MNATQTRVPVGNTSLYARAIGEGPPVIVLHGGPDFDCGYLFPDVDRLQDGYRLIYYDQRGRGKSAPGVRPEDVTLASDVADLDAVRKHFQLDRPALLGHSWGAVLALEYAVRQPDRVSRLILVSPAPASASDRAVLRKDYLERLGADMDRQQEIVAGAAYRAGDPEAVAARYRIHFEHALERPSDYETLMTRMRAGFRAQGSEGIRKAVAIEDRLMQDTWEVEGYDLLPRLRGLHIPTLVVDGERDLMPSQVTDHVAQAIPGAERVTIDHCGHFAFLERPEEVRTAVDAFFARTGRSKL